MAEGAADLNSLMRILGHDFADASLLGEALTHSSSAAVSADNYERLEFLGDRVIGLVIAELLFSRFPEEREGALARRHATLVSRRMLHEVAQDLDLGRYLRVSDPERTVGTHAKATVLGDACEAVIGALYLDGGLEAARGFVLAHWERFVADSGAQDAKTRLQEWVQGRALALPQYRVVSMEGPAHQPLFTIEVSVIGAEPAAASGKSKQEAEQKAALKLFRRLAQSEDTQ